MQEKQNKKNGAGLVWFRNDLRTLDNPSLSKALDESETVFAVYCFDPRHYQTNEFGFLKTSPFRAQFLIESVDNLHFRLLQLNLKLIVTYQQPEDFIPTFCTENDVTKVYLQKEWTSEELIVTNTIKKLTKGVEWIEEFGQFLYHPTQVAELMPKIPPVFTNFRTKLEKYSTLLPLEVTNLFESQLPESTLVSVSPSLKTLFGSTISSEDTAFFATNSQFNGGQVRGMQRLCSYLFETKAILTYKETRNGLLETNDSTKLSPWLANGSLSPMIVFSVLKKFEEQIQSNDSTYWLYFELLWRDYFKYVSMQSGNLFFHKGGLQKQHVTLNNNFKIIEQWINGTTDDDFVNANMIELKTTGWMSNRGRQNVASYFCKELKQDWRIGAAYFESMLVDYDVHSNYGNWLYLAGLGNDPRDRKFNTQLQAQTYDPNYEYRNKWLTKKTRQ